MNDSAGKWRQIALDLLASLGLLFALGAVFAIGDSGKAPMDIVFILDEGAGLAESAEPIKKSWLKIATSLTKQGIDCRFAVIPCHPESGQIPRVPLTSDMAELERRLTEATSDLDDPHDAWPVTDCLKALDDVLDFDFRDDASPVIYLTTNSIVENEDRLGELADKFRDRGIKTIIQANRSDQDRFHAFYDNGGQFYTLAGENKTETSGPKADGNNVDFGNLLSAVNRDAEGELAQVEKLLVGVKVKGRIALVCDISGSMRDDFPPLVKELRENFPKDTPLILVQGCHFAAPDSSNRLPVKLSQTDRSQDVLGVDLSGDPYVYFAENTTDAILLAIRQFRRDTVMFNNDLQDSGSTKAIAAFEELWKQRRFTLSGRSLNRDAPHVLKDFIQKSEGDFQVDPINRTVAPAINWSPIDLVFVLDEGAGLAESAGQIKQTWLKIAKSLTTQGMDCRFAVLPCQPESDQIPRVSLTPNVAELERRLTDPALKVPGNAWPTTDSLKALEEVLELDFREDASPVVFLMTNNVVDDEDRLLELAGKYRERGIETIIQANRSDQDRFRPLYIGRGQFYTLAGENKTETSESEVDSQNVDFGNLLSTLGQDSSDEKILVGVKVRGKIALVCDISGSMTQDFPPLVKELRANFPKDTPLILVVGCHFGVANPGNQKPIKNSRTNVFGVDFSNDPHVYAATNTTDAIILAVKQFRRDTVMFNNDLQDSGSTKAVDAFDDLWKERRFTLSGRSLNCDAPQVLKDFIRKSGGDFKVDPINRVVAPAVNWSQ